VEAVRLKALIAVAETGSISRAARREGSTRAAMTRHLDELTREVGAPLLETDRRGATLTDVGERLVQRAPLVIRAAALIEAEFEEPSTSPGCFRFAFPVGLSSVVLADITRIGSQLAPGSRFEVIVTPDPLDLLGDHADLALVFGPDIPDGPWRTATVGKLTEGLWATPSYLARHGTPTTVQELAKHRLLRWVRPGADPGTLSLIDGSEHPIKPWLISTDAWHVQRSTELAVGIGLFPTGRLPRWAHSVEELTRVLPDQFGRPCTLQVLLASTSIPRLRWRTLLEAARIVLGRG
jgi:DNA-binding transcriptional LysR family regulator